MEVVGAFGRLKSRLGTLGAAEDMLNVPKLENSTVRCR